MLNSLEIAKPAAETRVVVAMSGGVDSSVVAGLLARQGYEVIGITLQLYDHGEATHRKGACCAGQDIHDARNAADRIGVPHYVLDYEKQFKEQVIDPFTQAYSDGETPVPCITCNQTVKFEDLMRVAKDLGADALATGHYIQSYLKDGKRQLFRPADTDKDQSYFLFATTPEQLDFLRFPLGGLSKAETRELAREMDLEVADKSESQDICFVPQGKYVDVIAKMHPEALQEGDIVHLDGRVLGRHKGVVNFTVGQRRGLGIAAPDPLYVIKIDPRENQVIVGPHDALKTYTVKLRNVNWLGDGLIADAASGNGMPVLAKVRSTRAPQDAVINVHEGEIFVTLITGEHGISPGQACVFYANAEEEGAPARVLGGGFISEAVPSSVAA